DAGVAGISIWRNTVTPAEGGVGLDEAVKIVKGSGLAVPAYVRGGFFPAFEADDRQKAIDHNKTMLDEAAALELLSGLDGSEPTVLINHKPNHVEEAAAAGVKLQLSGHTHGGPVFPVNIIMRHLLKGRHHGTSKVGGMVLDVSSGSGISLWYPRTAGRHELVVVEFSAADSRR
ncbi:MAG: hypothetical protein RQ801_14530, partial [Spirochaetaceae bacterium]|nr:hypothetical protein [Spirochaetaceae bacterium]